jgi:hypothetical protein
MDRTPSEKPTYWIIQTGAGWLLRRFWFGRYDTLLILRSREEAVRELAAVRMR